MTQFIKQTVLRILEILRGSPLRRMILSILVRMHNTSYHALGFFASPEDNHPKHRIQNYHEFFLKNISSEDNVLDIGSGTGAVAHDIAGKAKKVTGIDILKKNVLSSRKKYERENLVFIEGDATTFVFQETFDVITLSNVLEHIKKPRSFSQGYSKTGSENPHSRAPHYP